jgi:hypothetical protein
MLGVKKWIWKTNALLNCLIMSQHQELETATFECPKCLKELSSQLLFNVLTLDDGFGCIGRRVVSRVEDMGACEVARNAANPGLPTAEEISECPLFRGGGIARKHREI